MKRSRQVDLPRLRHPLPAALAVAVAMISLSGCSSPPRPVDVFRSAEDCNARLNDEDLCRMLRAEAQRRMRDAAPSYDAIEDCAAEFGDDRCFWTLHPVTGRTVATPDMAGWMIDRQRRYTVCDPGYFPYHDECVSASPLVQPTTQGTGGSSWGGSSGGGRWYTPDGQALADAGNNRVLSDGEPFSRPGTASSATLRRGGFGRVIADAHMRGSWHFGA